MNKKIIFRISIIVNIILALVLALGAVGAARELHFSYAVKDTIRPETIQSNLERENYGTAASLSHPVRGGAVFDEEYREYYTLGEYADLRFLKEIFEKAGNTDTVQSCDRRMDEIRAGMPEQAGTLDKIDQSVKNAITE